VYLGILRLLLFYVVGTSAAVDCLGRVLRERLSNCSLTVYQIDSHGDVKVQHLMDEGPLKAKFHYASWFGDGSELASVMEFGFYEMKNMA